MNTWRLLLTRTAPDCYQQAEALKTQGIFCQTLPLINIEPLTDADLPLDIIANWQTYTAIIVISRPAAQLILKKLTHTSHLLSKSQQWFAVGSSTAAVFNNTDINVNYPTTGDDSEALWQHPVFEQAKQSYNARFLIIKGERGRPWLKDQLIKAGVPTDELVLYKRTLPDYPLHKVWQQITDHQLNAIVLSSGEGLMNLYKLTSQNWLELVKIPLFVPSLRIAQQAEELGALTIINCRGANINALISAIKYNKAP